MSLLGACAVVMWTLVFLRAFRSGRYLVVPKAPGRIGPTHQDDTEEGLCHGLSLERIRLSGPRSEVRVLHLILQGEEQPRPRAVGSVKAFDWLLFAGSEVQLAPGGGAAMVSMAMDNGLGWLSARPSRALRSWWDKLVSPLALAMISVRLPLDPIEAAVGVRAEPEGGLVEPPQLSRRRAFAYERLLLVRADVYVRLGDDRGFVGAELEDAGIAEQAAFLGFRGLCIDGSQLASIESYESPSSWLEGMGKEVSRLRLSSYSLLAWLGVLFVLGWAPWIGIVWEPGWAQVAVLIYATAIEAWLRGRNDHAPRWAIATPLGVLGVAGLLLRSAWLGRGVGRAPTGAN